MNIHNVKNIKKCWWVCGFSVSEGDMMFLDRQNGYWSQRMHFRFWGKDPHKAGGWVWVCRTGRRTSQSHLFCSSRHSFSLQSLVYVVLGASPCFSLCQYNWCEFSKELYSLEVKMESFSSNSSAFKSPFFYWATQRINYLLDFGKRLQKRHNKNEPQGLFFNWRLVKERPLLAKWCKT